MYIKHNFILTFCLVYIFCYSPGTIQSQRNLFHWKHDLEFRLNSYQNQRHVVDNILSSSIYRAPNEFVIGSRGGNVRFTDLVIPTGSLILDSHSARSTVRILNNKTQSYVSSKMGELYQIRSQLDTIQRQIQDPSRNFIYKGLPNVVTPQVNSSLITGTRVFKQFMYGHIIESKDVELRQINFTNVDQVLKETYMENTTLGLLDSKSRLFFEGRKTFWKTVFIKQLNSGCCDRLKPLHTNRMMTRSTVQEIFSPVLFQTNNQFNRDPVVIQNLFADTLYNRLLIVGLVNNRAENYGLIPSPVENIIHLPDLINIRLPNQPEIQKTLVFKNILMLDEGHLSTSYTDNKLLIGFLFPPNLRFDLSHDNYLLKFATTRNKTLIQQVAGTLVVNSESHFLKGLDAGMVNQVANFNSFVKDKIVRIDRPATITSSVQFNALPSMLNPIGPSRLPQNVLIMYVKNGLQVDLVNGMRLQHDLVFLPPHPLAANPQEPIVVRGAMSFANQIVFREPVRVQTSVNGLQIPAEIVPLHQNDPSQLAGVTNLWFVDGIVAHDLEVISGQFDGINLNEGLGDAPSLIMQSVFAIQPDGSRLIRAPLRIMNLKLFGQSPSQGLLNGFRPQDLIELSRKPVETIYGKKTFLAPVEVADCVFNDINYLANWTNHLIRIDTPNTVQTVSSKLGFVQPAMMYQNIGNAAYLSPQVLYNLTSSVNINNFQIEFYPNTSPVHYLNNLNYSPEFYILHQALAKGIVNGTKSRYRVLDQVRLMPRSGNPGLVNGILLNDIVTLDEPFRFAGRYVMVGKVDVRSNLLAGRVTSAYPIDAMDLDQFNKYRVPIIGSRATIHLNNLVLTAENQASFVRCHMLNGISFSEFANSIMSLTRPQTIDSAVTFAAPVDFEGLIRTESSLNNIKHFKQFANQLKTVSYSFEDGLQCNSVMIKV